MFNNFHIGSILSKLLFINFIYYYFVNIFNGIIKAGRWDINSHIFFMKKLQYSLGQIDYYFPTSPYFPGIGFLGYIINIFTENFVYINNILIIIGVTIGFTFFSLLRTYLIKTLNIKNIILFDFIYLIVLIKEFYFYLFYMNEFKPDTLILLISLFIIFSETKNIKKHYYVLFLLSLISILFKQSFFFTFIALIIRMILIDKLPIKKFILNNIINGLIGILILFLMFYYIEGLFYSTVTVMSTHKISNLDINIGHIIHFIKKNPVFNILIIGCALYIFKNYKNIFLKLYINKKLFGYIIFCLLWLFYSIISMIKTGGNAGNLEVGIFPLLPLIIFANMELFKNFLQNKKNINIICGFLLILITILVSKKTFDKYEDLKSYKIQESAEIKFISDNFKGKKFLTDNFHIHKIMQSGGIIITDANTFGHYREVEDSGKNIKNFIKNQIYDVIYIKYMMDDEDINLYIKKYYKKYDQIKFDGVIIYVKR